MKFRNIQGMRDKKIKLQNIRQQNLDLSDGLIQDLIELLDSGTYVSNISVENFEKEFSKYVEAKYAIGVSSGSSALEIGLRALGIKSGDEVIVPSLTFIATIEAVLTVGAVPVLIDVNKNTWNLDPVCLGDAISKKTKAVIPVHLHGRLADMENITKIAEENNIRVVEDAAQAHGASRNGKTAGSIGDIAAFSFYPGKNLGALGEAGAITTNNQIYFENSKLIRNYGSREKYKHITRGNNFRMDELQGKFLIRKLGYLNKWTEQRIKNAKIYDQILDDLNIPHTIEDEGRHVYHIYSVLVENRDKVMSEMKSNGVEVSIHYPVPCHKQEGYKNFVKLGSNLSQTEYITSRLLSLPMDERIKRKDIEFICKKLKESIRN
jgi:dTDP-4-amino-4,6-dideoxygalactose transaminase